MGELTSAKNFIDTVCKISTDREGASRVAVEVVDAEGNVSISILANFAPPLCDC